MFQVYCLQLICFIITTFLYILVLISLFRGWRSRESGVNIAFSKLCFVTGICDLLTLTNNNLLNVLPKLCFLGNFYHVHETFLVHIYLFFAWGGGASQGLCVLAIAFNRLTIVVSPETSTKYWNSKWIYLIFGIQTLPGLLVGCITLPFSVQWKRDLCSFIATFVDANIPRLYFKIAAVFLLVVTIMLIVFYSIIVAHLKNLHKIQLNFSQSSTTKRLLYRQILRESRLLTISCIICAIQILYVIYIVLRELTQIDRSYIGISIMGDLCAGINPYLLLIFSPLTRKRAWKILNCKNKIKLVKIEILSAPKPAPELK